MRTKLDEYFLVITPEFENTAESELNFLKATIIEAAKKYSLEANLESYKVVSGGIELQCNYVFACLAHYYLRIPTRILMRVAHFKATFFPKIYDNLKKLPWHEWLRDQDTEISVSCHRSRLMNKNQIETVVRDSIGDSTLHDPLKKADLNLPQTVFIRIIDDIVHVSIDMSGERLDVRGYKPNVSDAPVRETIAAGLLWYIKNHSQEVIDSIWDPFCGGGTFAVEALMMGQPNVYRNYAWQDQPICPTSLRRAKPGLSLPVFQLKKILLSDISEKSVATALKNKEYLTGLKKLQIEWPEIKVEKSDYRKMQLFSKYSLVIANIPYGERIKTTLTRDLVLSDLMLKQPQSVIGVLHADRPGRKTKIKFSNGGIPVSFDFV